MHTVWKGSISFGLVNIPVKLHAATENKDVKLRQLHKECHTPCYQCQKWKSDHRPTLSAPFQG